MASSCERTQGNSANNKGMPFIHETIKAPDFQSGEWVNSPPLSLAGLRARITLVDFWDYSCINCMRVLPYLQEWWRRYREAGFMLIGVHSPAFAFGRELANVTRAVQRFGLDYPILQDHRHLTWLAWANRFWPTKYLVDAEGRLRYFHYGEGGYAELETMLQTLLRSITPGADFPPVMAPLRASDHPDARCAPATPEQYLGYQRSRLGNAEPYRPGYVSAFSDPGTHRPDTVYLSGYWLNGPESLTLAGREGELQIRYRGKEVYLVMGMPEGETGVVEIYQDGSPLACTAMGEDVRLAGGVMTVPVEIPRLYGLIDNRRQETHDLRLVLRPSGLSIYILNAIPGCADEILNT